MDSVFIYLLKAYSTVNRTKSPQGFSLTQRDRLVDRWIEGLMGGYVDRWIDGWIGGQRDRWVDRWTEG